eukprot:358751-Chlamydomonas_euryale.AAC.5
MCLCTTCAGGDGCIVGTGMAGRGAYGYAAVWRELAATGTVTATTGLPRKEPNECPVVASVETVGQVAFRELAAAQCVL